jgi:hypothetical protein
MDSRIARNMQYQADLFCGPFRGHGIIMEPQLEPADWTNGDFTCVDDPFATWAPYLVSAYEKMVAWSKQLGDDNVPYIRVHTGTQIFAQAFGAPVHVYGDPGSPPSAQPLVTCGKEADKLQIPTLEAEPIPRLFAMADYYLEKLGPEVPIGICDIQSPFDIAALIWDKEELFVALHTEPDAVLRLVEKCDIFLRTFIDTFKRRYPSVNLCHCPTAWAPPESGLWLSEDEVGSMSPTMFEKFCLPVLTGLSEHFGGIYMHCCAAADHQYAGFNKIPNLRGLNRVFQDPGPGPAIRAFAGKTVLVNAWFDEATVNSMLDMAQPDSRFLFNMPAQPLDDAKRTFERLRTRCPRQG